MMGTSWGAVKFEDGLVLFCLYQNTSDVMHGALYSREKAEKIFLKEEISAGAIFCYCGKDEPVEIMADYADGYFWSGRACRTCRTITQNQSPYPLYSYGHDPIVAGPDWLKNREPEWSPFKEEALDETIEV